MLISIFFVLVCLGVVAFILSMCFRLWRDSRLAVYKADLEESERSLDASQELVADLYKAIKAKEVEASQAVAGQRAAYAQLHAVTKLRDATDADLFAIKVDGTKLLETFNLQLHDLLGKHTGKPLEQRLRENFGAAGIKEI